MELQKAGGFQRHLQLLHTASGLFSVSLAPLIEFNAALPVHKRTDFHDLASFV